MNRYFFVMIHDVVVFQSKSIYSVFIIVLSEISQQYHFISWLVLLDIHDIEQNKIQTMVKLHELYIYAFEI